MPCCYVLSSKGQHNKLDSSRKLGNSCRHRIKRRRSGYSSDRCSPPRSSSSSSNNNRFMHFLSRYKC